MTRRYGSGRRPVDAAIEGTGVWPDCAVDPADRPAVVALTIAAKTRAAADDHGLGALAEAVGVSHTTLGRIIRGEIWATIATVAALEAATGDTFWPAHD